jgi:DNA invertase Pin-like site-specific DNA recombinase
VKIKQMADRHEFDILGIYMSDRLGRIADETPLVVAYLNARGIRVLSYTEGEITSATHSEKLMTYIRYWQSEGESLKTSKRVEDAGINSVRLGKWRGGAAPFGYKAVSRGTLNYKGRPIFDIEIDPTDSETVKTIFRLYVKEHYGSKAVAKYLNDHGMKTQDGKLWECANIIRVLRNRIYIGIYELHKNWTDKPLIPSPVMPNMVIISEEDFNGAQKLLDVYGFKENRRRPTQYGSMLLTGLLYCGECGAKFTSNLTVKPRKGRGGKSPVYESRRYRCSSYMRPRERTEKCHQKLYKAEYIEHIVIKDAKKFISAIDRQKLIKSHDDDLTAELNRIVEQSKKTAKEFIQKEKELDRLNGEVLKALMGQSDFDGKILNGLVQTTQSEIARLTEKQTALKKAEEGIKEQIAMQKTVCADLDTWAERFDAAGIPEKKTMLINIIDRITITDTDIAVDYKFEVNPMHGIYPVEYETAVTLNNPLSIADLTAKSALLSPQSGVKRCQNASCLIRES